LRFQIEEIDRVGPEPGEHEALRRRVTLMREAHRWVAFAQEARGVLYEDDGAIASRLASLAERARGGSEDSEHLAQIEEQLAAAQIACEEAAQLPGRGGGELVPHPRELELADDRLHELEGLRRKHATEVDDLAARAEQMREELEELEHAADHLAALRARTEELEASCRRLAGDLHDRRAQAADGLGRAVERELAALQIPNARLEVALEQDLNPGPRGFDQVEFLFSANRGEPVAPLRRVASGGELSRVLLAIKGVLAAGDRVATYVFDEVDAGVGGAVAEAIGQRLRQAAAGHQVLCITHLPQIAAFADAHFRVEKHTRAGRTVTAVVRLSDEERVEELARMLGGKKVTHSAREHAVALLAQSRRRPRGRKAAAVPA
jgi:DNA repair protein RecN (Recombination protein N)